MSVYNAEISAGSLLPLESRRIAALLLTAPDETAWHQAIEVENILQKKTAATARRQARLIRKRLATLDAVGLAMLASREKEVVLQLLLVASIRHSQLLGDFIRNVYAVRQRRLERNLALHDWQDFLADCARRDAAVTSWTETTRAKLYQVVVRILVEARYLDQARALTLTPQSLHPEVRQYLCERNDSPMIACLERTP